MKRCTVAQLNFTR